MRKFFRILLITTGVVLLLLITLPMLFKSKIESVVKDQINQNLLATVDWSRFSLTLFRGFPDLSINLHGLSVIGVEPFAGDTLVALNRFELRVNPFGAVKKNLKVKSILLVRPVFNGIVLEDGSANWDIAPVGEEDGSADQPDDTGESMSVNLKRFAMIDGRILYRDASVDVEAVISKVDLELKGDFSMDKTDLELIVNMNGIDAKYGGIRYMKQGVAGIDLEASANMAENKYMLKKNEITVNGLVLGAEGEVALLDNGGMDLDLRFFSRETSFQTLLSMVPAIYLQDFEAMKSSGNFKLEGNVKGMLLDTVYPDATLVLQVTDGFFSYPDLPRDVSDVQIALTVDYRGTDMDATKVSLERFHLLLGGNPFDMKLKVEQPFSDMHVTGEALGMIDFASLKEVIPMEDVVIGGRLETDLRWDTRMSYIEQEQYEKVDLSGSLVIEDFQVEAPDIPVPVELQKLEMVFNPRVVELLTMDLLLGSSDLHLDGELTNFVPYIFNNKTVSGSLNVVSSRFDANELMPEDSEDLEDDSSVEEQENENEAARADSLAEPIQVRIPENLDFKMAVDMQKVTYDQIEMSNIKGDIWISEGVAHLEGLTLDVIEGSVSTTGIVDTRGDFTDVDVMLDMKDVDIPSAYQTFVTVERLAPMAQYCKGSANIKMQYQSLLDASFNPLYESINAKGRIFTKGLQIYNLNSFVRLSELLKNEKFREMAPDEVNLGITVRDGRVMVDPFDISFDDSKITVSGSHGIDLTMDYLLDMNIARADLGAGANDLMSGISALAMGAGFKLPQSDYLKVKATITGTFGNPKISTDLSGNIKKSGETIKTEVKEKVIKEVQKVEEEVREQASEKAGQIISDAEREAENLIEEARKAGEKLVKEADVQGENLVKEAGSNPIKKVAANRAAEELKNQAQKQSDNLVKEAEVKAGEILNKAREEAARIE